MKASVSIKASCTRLRCSWLIFDRLRFALRRQSQLLTTCVCYRPAKQRSTGLPIKISKFFPKQAFRQRKRRKKRLWFFWLGGYLLVDSVAIGVGRGPNRPMLAGLLELQKGDSVSEFMDQRI